MLNRAIKKTTYSFIQKRGGARRKDFYRIIILLREFGKNTEYKIKVRYRGFKALIFTSEGKWHFEWAYFCVKYSEATVNTIQNFGIYIYS